jgi:ribosomal protein S18 acetylase RimI-like enzyme
MFESMIYRPARCPQDTPSLLAIENASFPTDLAWDAGDFSMVVASPATHILLAERTIKEFNEKLGQFVTHTDCIGYMAYSHYGSERVVYQIENLAVTPEYRREGVATSLVKKLISIGNECRNSPRSPVRQYKIKALSLESNLGAHLFLRSLGFRCHKIIHHFYEDQAAYSFKFER